MLSKLKNPPSKLGQKIEALRAEKGLSLAEITRQAGISNTCMTRIMHHPSIPCTVPTVRAVANTLGMELSQLLEGVM